MRLRFLTWWVLSGGRFCVVERVLRHRRYVDPTNVPFTFGYISMLPVEEVRDGFAFLQETLHLHIRC